EKELAESVSQSRVTNQAQVALFSLEAAAQSYRKIYDNFLQQHTASIQQQTFPVTEARQVSAGSAVKTWPKPLLVWIGSIFAGGVLGVGLGTFREIRDRGFRTREQVQSNLATECLALVPLLNDGRRRMFSGRQSVAMQRTGVAIADAREIAQRNICYAPKAMRTIINSPTSPYAEAIPSIKLVVDLNTEATKSKIIGLTSCLPSEGKSTVAAAIATHIAQGGARVILLDCDFRRPSVSRALAPNASAGLLDVVAGKL